MEDGHKRLNVIPNHDDGVPRESSFFPFTTVIVTNPDEASALAAQQLLDSTLKNHLKALYPHQEVRLLSTYDPFGARCGSFGGTLAAVDLLDAERLPHETILCLHAGGDSSRCPLSMIIGKAWQELPSSRYRNPTFWLIHQLEALFHVARIPSGSLLVAATDCLVSLGNVKARDIADPDSTGSETPEEIDPCTVLGVGVPAPLKTAKNHGVYIMPECVLQKFGDGSVKSVQIEDPIDVWQKPSTEQLMGTCNDSQVSFDIAQRDGKQAWIDVGIVIFYPRAFQTLCSLSDGLLSKCTRRGLDMVFQQQKQLEDCKYSLEEFAKKNALKVDLYTDILHNLPWANKRQNETNMTKGGSSDDDFRTSLKKSLSNLLLKILVVPEGNFLHLGTTTELIEFITCGSNPTNASTVPKAVDKIVTRSLAKTLQLDPRFESWSYPALQERSNSNVTLWSIFPEEPDSNVSMGKSTLVEYSNLCCYSEVRIGDHCMLSGWRCPIEDDVKESGVPHVLQIPNGLSVQLLSVMLNHGNNPITKNGVVNRDKYVLMVLGTDDSIKTPIRQSTLFDVPIEDFLKLTKLTMTRLGMKESIDDKDCLWVAKIHPIVHAGDVPLSFELFFDWISKLRAGDPDILNNSSFQRWLTADKVSLKDLHNISDAGKEWKFRRFQETKLWQLESDREINCLESLVMQKRCGVPCELRWLMEMEDRDMAYEALCRLVSTLEQVATDALSEKAYDVAGRAFMLASAILAEFQEEASPHPNTEEAAATKCDLLLHELKQSSTRTISMEKLSALMKGILAYRRDSMHSHTLAHSSNILEQLALRMTEFTISDGFRRHLDPTQLETIKFKREGKPILDKWVISVAPARVDLAGGWSDTPPICYEYGGSVTGMAVLVDQCYPLSCRCRVVSGKTGILLRSEMRDITSGALLNCQHDEISTVGDISGFRDPSISCALVKAALICLGMVTEEQISQSTDLQPLLNSFCSAKDDVRLEIVTTSLLGLGTGMGTSSILGACVLQSIAESVGIGKMSDEFTLHAVLMLEQILSSGGGWQDQAHGILPGVKTVRSMPPQLPLKLQIERLELSNVSLALFEGRLMFAYTGQTRLAKNILQQVLRRWSRRTSEIVDTVESLVKFSEQVRKAFLEEDWDSVAEVMHKAYQMKCVMAGKESGAEPESVKIFMSKLVEAGLIKGAMLCGAGGGGFLLLLRSQGVSEQEIKDFFVSGIAPLSKNFDDFSFHECSVASRGLTTSILYDNEMNAESFDLSWHK